MARNTVLWIDLAVCAGIDTASSLPSQYHIVRVGSCGEIETAIISHSPDVLCFNFDTPHPEEMAILQAIKNSYPYLPIIMLTDYHSEALAIWAMRVRVWDYFVKPVALSELEATFKQLISIKQGSSKNSHRILYPPGQTNFLHRFDIKNNVRMKRTQASICYVEENYARRITLNDAAKRCYLSQSAFSHLFRKENDMTFSEYLLRYRMDKASELLLTSEETIYEIAYAVGFNDASYFSRTFRRILGTAPRIYRACYLAK